MAGQAERTRSQLSRLNERFVEAGREIVANERAVRFALLKAALDAFNVGWGVLHEFEHVVHDSVDAERLGEAGECESFINRMRRECGLAERAEYYFTLFPGTSASDFKTQFVRLAFDLARPGANRKERHWLIRDARLVGGLDEQKASLARM